MQYQYWEMGLQHISHDKEPSLLHESETLLFEYF